MGHSQFYYYSCTTQFTAFATQGLSRDMLPGRLDGRPERLFPLLAAPGKPVPRLERPGPPAEINLDCEARKVPVTELSVFVGPNI